MSKIFSKRSGFTLVEIIVAFGVFAIMAAMLVSLTGLAVKQRQSNYNFSKELSDQQAYLAAHERETTYKAADKGGNFEFDFGSGLNASLDYSVVRATDDETSEGGISYFVADANVNAKPVPGDPDGDDEDGGSLVLAEKVDSRIYGSKDFKYIRISEVKEVSDPDVLAAGNSKFTFDSYAMDNTAAQNKKDSRLARNYKLRFDSKVIDCGYVGGTPSSPVYISYRNAVFGSDGKVSGGGNNQFEVVKCSDDTIRVGIPQSIIKDEFAEKEPDEGYCFPGISSHLYVVLEGDVDLNEASFGDNYQINAYGQYIYKSVKAAITTTDKDGKDTTETIDFINVYGAKPKAGAVILDSAPLEEDE